MSRKASQGEFLVSKRSEQAKRDIEKLNAELQQLIEAGRNRSTTAPTLINSRLLGSNTQPTDTTRKTTTQERKTIKKTDLRPYTTAAKQCPTKSVTITLKSSNDKTKPYDVEEAREYMRKQKEKRFNSLKSEHKFSEQSVQERKQKLQDLQARTKKILINNVKRSRSRSKSKEKNGNEDVPPDKQQTQHQHVSRKPTNTDVFRVNPDVISNLPSTSANQGSNSLKESIHKNVTVRKSPRTLTSGSSTSILIVTADKDINAAATIIQAAFKGFKQRKRFKKDLIDVQLSKKIYKSVEEPFKGLQTKIPSNLEDELNKQITEVPKWLQTKLSSAPYNVAKSFKRKLAFEANVAAPTVQEFKVDIGTQNSENLLGDRTQSREEIKQMLEDSVKNSKHKDLKSFLSHKCLDLDLKKIEELNLISKERLRAQKSSSVVVDSDASDTSKNIPDLSAGSSLNEDYSLDINSKRLKELKLRSRNASLRQQQVNATFDTQSKIKRRVHSVGKLPSSLLEAFQETNSKHSSHNTSRKDSSTVDKSIELENSSREITLNLFNPNKMKDMLLLTALNCDLEESMIEESARQSENALSLVKSYSQSPKSCLGKSENQTLSNSEVELEFCSNVSKKPTEEDSIKSKSRDSKRSTEYFLDLVSERNNILHFDHQSQSTIDDSVFSATFESDVSTVQKLNNVLSSTAKTSRERRKTEEVMKQVETVIPLNLGESVTATANSNQINVKFQAEIHLLNDFNQSLHNLVGVEKSLNYLEEQNAKPIYQNQNTQTSFVSSNKSTAISPNKYTKSSVDVCTERSNETNIFNSSVDCSLLNESIFEKFDKISNCTKDDSVFNDTQVSKVCDNSLAEGEKYASAQEIPRPSPISQEALSLQHFEQLIKDEDARRDYLKTIFEIRKGVLLDRTKVELSMLEIKKKHLVETGQLNEASVIRKKQRGILIKLQHEKYEMQRLMQMQKAAWKERKNNLKEQQNVIKAQLTLNDDTTVAKIKKSHHMDRRSSGPLKVFAPVVAHRLSTSHRRSDTSVTSRCSSSVAEELIVTTSYHSDSVRLSDGSVTSVTESRKTTVTTEQRQLDSDKDDDLSVIITEVEDGNKSGLLEDESERQLIKSLECVDAIRDGANSEFGRGDVLVATSQMDYFSIERMQEMTIVESQIENNKRLLLMKEDALQKRRKAAEELLEWHQRLLEEEKKVAALEMAATSVITHRPMQQKSISFINYQPQQQQQMNLLWSTTSNKMTGNKESAAPADNVASPRSDLNNSVNKTVLSEEVNSEVESDYEVSSKTQEQLVKTVSSDGYSCEFDPGETTDNIEEGEDEELSVNTVKSSEHDYEDIDVNIIKSQSTLKEIMHNISIISEELSEIHRISSGNNRLVIDDDGQLVETQTHAKERFDKVNNIEVAKNEEQKLNEQTTLKTAEEDDESLNSGGVLVPTNFDLEEAEIIEQNIRIIEKEIEELQSRSLSTADKNKIEENSIPEDAETTISNNLATDSQIKSALETDIEEICASEEKVLENVEVSVVDVASEKVVEDMDVSSTKASEIVENLSSIDLIEMSEDKTSENSDNISQNKTEILENGSEIDDISRKEHPEISYSRKTSLEENGELKSNQIEATQEIDAEDLNNSIEDTVDTPRSFDLDDSIPEKSELSSKAPDIIESMNRNSEDNSSKMPEILENLNAADSSPSHSSEPSLEEPLHSKIQEEFSEDFEEVSIDLPSSEAMGIAIANDDIMNTVRICKQAQEESGFDVLDESSVIKNDATFIIDDNALDDVYRIREEEMSHSETFEEDISSGCSLQEESAARLLDVTLLNDSNKENEFPVYKELERLPSFYGTSETTNRRSPRINNVDNNNSNNNSNELSVVVDQSKTAGVLNVKKRVSEILADAKQKAHEKSTRIQDLYTTTYDVSYTEKASEIVSDLDQLDAEYISPKLVEVKAEELELLKKQWAIEQEIKQLEEQQLSEQREQLPYQYLREIPNKPPPPYTPPVNQLPVVTIPSVIPSSATQLSSVLPTITDYLYTCHLDKALQSAEIPLDSLAIFPENTLEINELLFDLTKELTETHYAQFGGMTDDDYTPSWMRSEETISSLKKPLDKEGLYGFSEEKLLDLYGFTEIDVKESSIMRWSRKKRDHVDEVLVRELPADECNWTNFELDELIVKDKLVEDLTDLLLKEVLGELKDWWTAKNT